MDRRIKLAFLAVVLGVVVWQVVAIYYGPSPPVPYSGNLKAALAKAAQQNRKVVLIVYQRPPTKNYKDLVTRTMRKPNNINALRASGDLVVRTTMSDPALKPYKIAKTPTLLLLRPDGRVAARREGAEVVAEVPFKHDFLEAPPVPFGSSLQAALRQAIREHRRVLLLVDQPDQPKEETRDFLTKTLWEPENIKALDQSGVICVQTASSDPAVAAYYLRKYPALLLLNSEGNVLARRSGTIDSIDFRTSFLLGKDQPASQ